MDSLNTDLHAAADCYVNGSNCLTPIQLAILWNLPTAIRVLCKVTTTNPRVGGVGGTTTTVSTSSSKNLLSTDKDKRDRTPLMLACEFS